MTGSSLLVAALAEAKLRLRDLTRTLDESLSAEQDGETGDELERVRLRILELERMIAETG